MILYIFSFARPRHQSDLLRRAATGCAGAKFLVKLTSCNLQAIEIIEFEHFDASRYEDIFNF